MIAIKWLNCHFGFVHCNITVKISSVKILCRIVCCRDTASVLICLLKKVKRYLCTLISFTHRHRKIEQVAFTRERYHRIWNGKKESTRFVPMTSLVLISFWHDRRLFTGKFCVTMSSNSQYQLKPRWSRSDLSARRPAVMPENGGNLSYAPHGTSVDSSIEITY